MKNLKNIFVLLLLITIKTYSQTDTSFWNNKLAEIAEPTSSKGWIRLKEGKNFPYQNFFAENKQAFGLGQNDEMILKKTKTDELGFTHYRYQHTYKGVKVEGCEYILHTQNGEVV
jgi:bacillolysin